MVTAISSFGIEQFCDALSGIPIFGGLKFICPTRFPPLRISHSHLLEWDNVFMGVVMKNSLIAAVLFGGFLAEPALPLIAATQAQKQTSEPAVPATVAPKT